MASIRSFRLKGNELFEHNQLPEAADAFQSGVHAFLDAHSTAADDVEEFVKVAGNWVVCLHQQAQHDKCVATGRELLATYPIIPKAYGAIGMCIIDALQRRQEVEATVDEQRRRMPSSGNTSPNKQAAAAATEVEPSSAEAGTASPAPANAARTSEELRQDSRRYWVKLGGVVCTVDDAHTYLCRAVGLLPSLQVSLQPYLDVAVRMISEQLFSAGPALERQIGSQRRAAAEAVPAEESATPHDADATAYVLDALCPAEDGLYSVPPTLATAPKPTITRVQMLNLNNPNGAPTSIPDSSPEAQAARKQYAEEQKQQQQQQSGNATGGAAASSSVSTGEGRLLPEQLRPVDFVFSGAHVPVRVCHSERGGLPRSLTLVRAAAAPFAVARWIQSVATTVGPDGTAQLLVSGHGAASRHVDPSGVMRGTNGSTMEIIGDAASAASGLTMGVLPAGLSGVPSGVGGTGSACCVACGKEMNSLIAAVICPTCGVTTYCSAACAEAYKARHDTYECAGLLLLQGEITAAAEASLPDSASPQTTKKTKAKKDVDEESEGAEVPGSAWTVPDLLHRVVPLTLAAYSGLRTRSPSWELVARAVERGVHRNLRTLLPPTVARVLARLEELLASVTEGTNPKAGDADTPSTYDLTALFFLCRLYQSRQAEHEVSSLHAERLLLRHSCEPNCIWSDVTHTVTTGRFIVKGEELTLAVDPSFPQHWPYQVRSKWLLRQHGFICQCARCLRESRLFNSARGNLSDDTIEQLLSADILRKPTVVSAAVKAQSPSTAAQLLPLHPTHFFHPLVQVAISAGRTGRQPPEKTVAKLHELRECCAKYLVASHYLFEDLRAAERALAELAGQADVTSTLGHESMLFLESLWAGAIPSKAQVMESIPQTFNCRRRPIHNRRMRRQNKTKPSAPESDVTQEATASGAPVSHPVAGAAASTGAAATTVMASAEPEKGIVEKYMGSYRAWYL